MFNELLNNSNMFSNPFHAFCIDKCMFYLQMPPVSLDSKKIFCLREEKKESIKLIGNKRQQRLPNVSNGKELE